MTSTPTGPGPSNQTPSGPSKPPLDALTDDAIKAARRAREQLARTVDANRGRIQGTLDKVTRAADQRTGGRYAKQVATARQLITKGVDAVAGTTSPATQASATPTTAQQPTAAPQQPPAAPHPPQTGWRRGPDGEWVRS